MFHAKLTVAEDEGDVWIKLLIKASVSRLLEGAVVVVAATLQYRRLWMALRNAFTVAWRRVRSSRDSPRSSL